jgi:hypothetical protein
VHMIRKSSDALDALRCAKIRFLPLYINVCLCLSLLFLNVFASMTSNDPIDLENFKFEEDIYGDDLFEEENEHEVVNL